MSPPLAVPSLGHVEHSLPVPQLLRINPLKKVMKQVVVSSGAPPPTKNTVGRRNVDDGASLDQVSRLVDARNLGSAIKHVTQLIEKLQMTTVVDNNQTPGDADSEGDDEDGEKCETYHTHIRRSREQFGNDWRVSQGN